jgi:23S rRNA (uracil1939-C5)-methyltransferase
MIDLQIENLVQGGRGVGRTEGKAVFVPYTLPGEQVRCHVTRSKKNYSEAELVAILEPSPQRQEPVCPVFSECGGCQWQHMSYPQQLTWKSQLFRESMLRAMPLSESLFQPIVASPNELNYRCRAQIKCRKTADGFVAGFYRAGSHFVVDIDQCPLLMPDLNRLFATIKPLFSQYAFAHRVPQLDLSVDDDGQLSLTVHSLDKGLSSLRELLSPVAKDLNCSVYVQKNRDVRLVELFAARQKRIRPLRDDSMQLQCPPAGFVQINLDQNRNLVADVLEQVTAGSKVMDLYCGIGNFSLPISRIASSVVGIEGYAPAIESARENCQQLTIENIDFVVADANDGLGKYWGEGFDLVLLDPPRAGAFDVVKQLAVLQPQKIVYVSCDPMTLSRDVKHLLANGYQATLFRAYDMFPQTAHIEGMVVLEYQS